MKIGVISLGCAKNQVDTEEMLALLLQNGYVLTPTPSEADILILNTCGFIASAKEESIDAILEMAEYKKTGVCKLLCVTGCLAQRYEKELLTDIPEIDVLIGVSQYEQLPNLILNALEGERVHDTTRNHTFNNCGRYLTTPPYSAYVRIADGCNNRCAYCAIPLIRGHFRSKSESAILEELKTLSEQGVKEAIFIAQDTTAYGKDLNNNENLIALLEKASSIPQLIWLRMLYCYPDEIDLDFLNKAAAIPKLCRYLDLPLQHASPSLLKHMNRRGDIQKTKELLIQARKLGFALRSTFIVGFPGETEEDFNLLLDFCREIEFDRIGAFAFSPEEDTPAFSMPDQIPDEIKQQRLDSLMRLQAKISLKRGQTRVGEITTALVTGKKGKIWQGRSPWETPDSDGLLLIRANIPLKEGEFITVRITHAHEYDLEAEYLSAAKENA